MNTPILLIHRLAMSMCCKKMTNLETMSTFLPFIVEGCTGWETTGILLEQMAEGGEDDRIEPIE